MTRASVSVCTGYRSGGLAAVSYHGNGCLGCNETERPIDPGSGLNVNVLSGVCTRELAAWTRAHTRVA